MSKIKVLDSKLINLIKAGEVIERPVNVVKELVENSIDAGSDKIIIELKNSGIEEISVSDNGIGMDKIDLKMASMLHSTSKISNTEDLYQIATFGFRGEALPSIKAVSDFYIESNDGSTPLGYYYHYLNNDLIEEGASTRLKGTKVIVKDLFKLTPARLKFLKSASTELNKIIDCLYKIAIVNKNIDFTLINNQKVIYQTHKNARMLEIIAETYGLNISKNMLEIDGRSDLYHIEGYVSNNQILRNNKQNIALFINKRLIKSYLLEKAIIEAYSKYLPINKYPLCLINITGDYSLIDVNCHPHKLEVRITDEAQLATFLTKLIKDKLDNSFYNQLFTNKIEIPSNNWEFKEDFKYEYSNSIVNKPSNQVSWDDFSDNLDNTKEEVRKNSSENPQLVNDEFRFSKLTYIGTFYKTYILASFNDRLFILDQHACAERVNYEAILNKFNNLLNESIDVITPLYTNDLIYHFDNEDVDKILIKESEIKKMGISLHQLTSNDFRCETYPTFVKKGVEKETILEIINLIINDKKVDKKALYDEIAKTVSCKMSLKANMDITQYEAEELFIALDECKMPYTCPHGRPSVISYSKGDFEKAFRRVL